MVCRFSSSLVGDQASQGSAVTSTLMLCITPSVGVQGLAAVEVSSNGVDYTASLVQFLFSEPISLVSVHPSILLAGTASTVTITGKGFRASDSATCALGQLRSRADWVSGTQVLCSISREQPGNVTVEVSNNGLGFSADSLRIQYMDKSGIIARMDPVVGAELGGTRVTFALSGLGVGVESVGVIFGENVASCTALEPSAGIACTSPASNGQGTVKVVITIQGSELHLSSPLQFRYAPVPVLRSLDPSMGPVSGGGLVRVRGQHFILGSTYCMFGKSGRHVVASVLSIHARVLMRTLIGWHSRAMDTTK